MNLNLKRREPEIILLVDGDRDSDVARKLLKERRVRFAEVGRDSLRESEKHLFPTLHVRGDTYYGLREIKMCINRNLHL